MGIFSSLTKEQKKTIGILQIGTFLEYFDLMLYIHMAVLLNDLFFPKSDPYTASLLAAFAFCSTHIMRPIGALLFGWMGDNIGRKSTIIFTTFLMSISCIVMATLPTYAEIGITAAWVITFCRMAQGLSSMGEIIGVEIYITEYIKRPTSYPAVALTMTASCLGSMTALGVSTLVTSFLYNWRIAFWMGAMIAIVGAYARTLLRETPEFIEMKRKKMRNEIKELNVKVDKIHGEKFNESWKEPINKKTLLSFFLIYCGWPLFFYLTYMYFNPMLKNSFGYSSEDVIKHNFLLSIIMMLSSVVLVNISKYIHPIKIIKIKSMFSFLLILLLPFIILNINSSNQLFILQAFIVSLSLWGSPADAVLIHHLPIYLRFTFASVLYALSRAIIYVVTSFGLIYLTNYFGVFGMWFITIPMVIAYYYGVLHFEYLERKIGIYPNLTKLQPTLIKS